MTYQSRRVGRREGQAVKDSEKIPTLTQHKDAQFTIEVPNNAAASRQNLDKTESRKENRKNQDVDRTEK